MNKFHILAILLAVMLIGCGERDENASSNSMNVNGKVINIGMTRVSVHKLLGEPADLDDGAELYYYITGDTEQYTINRKIIITYDINGMVVKLDEDFILLGAGGGVK